AWRGAVEAVDKAERMIPAAMDSITLPDHLPEGASAVDVVGAWEDDAGPLRGDTLARFDDVYSGLSPAERRRVDEALAAADSQEEKALIMRGVAAGMTGS